MVSFKHMEHVYIIEKINSYLTKYAVLFDIFKALYQLKSATPICMGLPTCVLYGFVLLNILM